MFCSACGNQLRDGAKFCSACGVGANAPTVSPSSAVILASPSLSPIGGSETPASAPTPAMFQSFAVATFPATQSIWPDLSPYYQEEFRRIQESGETYKGRWNWAAFLFGALWALVKGAWLSAIICIVVSMITFGFGGFVFWFIYGARGNYIYYCARVKGRQQVV
jgi:hypothetical protein